MEGIPHIHFINICGFPLDAFDLCEHWLFYMVSKRLQCQITKTKDEDGDCMPPSLTILHPQVSMMPMDQDWKSQLHFLMALMRCTTKTLLSNSNPRIPLQHPSMIEIEP